MTTGFLVVISYNVRGLRSPIKRRKILSQLQRLKCHLAFLQETQLPDREHEKLKKSWADKVYISSHHSGRKSGVAILLHRQVNFTPTKVLNDSVGKICFSEWDHDGIRVSLMNIYAPNDDDPDFVSSIFNTVIMHSVGILLLGGNFNCVMSQRLNRQPPPKTPRSKMSKRLQNLLAEAGFADVFRC